VSHAGGFRQPKVVREKKKWPAMGEEKLREGQEQGKASEGEVLKKVGKRFMQSQKGICHSNIEERVDTRKVQNRQATPKEEKKEGEDRTKATE